MLPEQGVALVQLIKAFPRPRPSGRTRRCSQPGSERAGGGPNFGPKRPGTRGNKTGRNLKLPVYNLSTQGMTHRCGRHRISRPVPQASPAFLG
jgi:hypothetical protein